MTVMATDNYKKFAGSGSPGPFTWTWRFLGNDDVKVYHIVAGVRTLLSEGDDYTLTGAGSYAGGSLTLTFDLEAGSELVVQRYTDALQAVSIRNQGNNFRPEVHEDVFDKLAMIAQDRGSQTERSIRVPEDEVAEIINDVEYDNRMGKVLGWNSLGELALMPMSFVSSSGTSTNPWADVREYASLADAVAQLGGLSIDLYVPDAQAVTDNLTVPVNIRLVVPNGGMITVAAGKTLTINGPVDAGDYRIFSGSGAVALSANASLYRREWVGLSAAGGAWRYQDTYVALRGKGANAAPRLYIMPSGSGEADTKAALKLFSADYEADPSNYKDMGFYYSATADAFFINSKATRNGTPTIMDAAPINLSANDSVVNTKLQYFVVKERAAENVVTGITGDPAVVTVTSSTGLSEGQTAWFRFSADSDVLIANRWFLGTRPVGGDNFTLNFSEFNTSELSVTAGKVQKLVAAAGSIGLGGYFADPDDAQFTSIGVYLLGNMGVKHGNYIRFQNYAASSYASSIRAGLAADTIEFIGSSGAVAARTKAGGIEACGFILERTTGTLDATTIDVANKSFVQIPAPTTTVTITNLVNGVEGQEVVLLCSSINITIQHNANIVLNGSANYTSSAGSTLTLIKGATSWYEKSRAKP